MAKKLLLALVSLLAALVVAELGLRGVLWLRGVPHGAAHTADELVRLLDPMRRFVPAGPNPPAGGALERRRPLLHPYTGSESSHDSGGVLAAFRQGFAPEEYVVVVVGGSVAASWAAGAQAGLAMRLEGDPRFAGKRLRLLNYAHASFKQPQQLMRVAYLFSLGCRPHAVLSIDGFNEVALALQNLSDGTHPVYPPPPVWGALVRELAVLDDGSLERLAALARLREEAERIVASTFRFKLHHSSLYGWYARQRMAAVDRRRFELHRGHASSRKPGPEPTSVERQRRGPDFDAHPDAVLAAGARNWAESSLSLHALCEVRGVVYLHVLQPTLHDEGAKPRSPEELALGPIPDGWERGAREGYPLLRGLVPHLENNGVHVFDASRVFADVRETLYVDHCHVNPRGNALLTEAIAAAFLEALPSH